MTLIKRGKIWHYQFEYRKTPYRGSTGQRREELARAVEQRIKDEVRAEAHGVSALTREKTPSFSAWGDYALMHWPRKPRTPKRRAELAGRIGVCLEFWGRAPKTPKAQPAVHRPTPDRPYHDRRLLDPILEPEQILEFEVWMTRRGLSGSRKNQLRSTMSMLYKVGLKPQHKRKSRVRENPFAGVDRDRVPPRSRVMTLDEIEAWMAAAPYHIRIAMAVAVLAPKLRQGNILALRFDRHLDPLLTRITVTEHKADGHKAALVVPVQANLRAILEFARRHNRSAYVVEWEGGRIHSVKTGMRASAETAGLIYGTKHPRGVTFHTIRHSMATLLATFPGLSEKLRAEIMGQTIQTAQKYTHLAAEHQAAMHEELAARAHVSRQILGGVFGGRAERRARPSDESPVMLRRVPRKKVATR